MGQTHPRPGETFSVEHVLSQKLGSAKFKIPTRRQASNQLGYPSASSNMGVYKDATSVIYIRGRHIPPPDLTTYAMLPALQMRNVPTMLPALQMRNVPICTDLPPHTASPVSRTPLTQQFNQDRDFPQYFSNEKYQQIEYTRVRAQHHSFGDAHGHIDASIALGREGSHVAQCMTSQRPHTQTILPTNYREATSPHQTGILHTKKGILNQPLYREPFAPRFHPEGGSFTHQPQGEHGCLKGFSYTQDAYTAENTHAQYFAKSILTPFNNLLATLHLHLTLHSQGIGAGDTVTLVTRHAKVHDPYGVQHFVAYRDEDIIQYFLSALQVFLPSPFYLSLLSATKASPWNPHGDSKIAIFPRSLPSTCALGANRVPILLKNL